MPANNFSLRPCTPADIPTLAALNLTSFNGPRNKVMYANVSPSDKLTLFEAKARHILNHPKNDSHQSIYYICIVDTSTNSIISHAVWNWLPNGYTPSHDPDTQHDWLPPGTNESLVRDFDRGTHALRTGHPGRKEAHWLLSLLATHPQHQGRGAAGMLIEWGTERADGMGVRCFVEASVAGLPLYRKKGFEVEVGVQELDLGEYEGGEGYGVQRWVGLMREMKMVGEM
ncbi:MAG: hypothetical protein Q9178_006017 [Gyalolechia marmorata]